MPFSLNQNAQIVLVPAQQSDLEDLIAIRLEAMLKVWSVSGALIRYARASGLSAALKLVTHVISRSLERGLAL